MVIGGGDIELVLARGQELLHHPVLIRPQRDALPLGEPGGTDPDCRPPNGDSELTVNAKAQRTACAGSQHRGRATRSVTLDAELGPAIGCAENEHRYVQFPRRAFAHPAGRNLSCTSTVELEGEGIPEEAPCVSHGLGSLGAASTRPDQERGGIDSVEGDRAHGARGLADEPVGPRPERTREFRELGAVREGRERLRARLPGPEDVHGAPGSSRVWGGPIDAPEFRVALSPRSSQRTVRDPPSLACRLITRPEFAPPRIRDRTVASTAPQGDSTVQRLSFGRRNRNLCVPVGMSESSSMNRSPLRNTR